VLDLSSELGGFARAAHATSARAWLDAMAGYVAPAQNMLVADRAGTIAIRSTGRFPIRPDNERGDVIHDGTVRTSDWVGAWPVSRYPFAMNPAQGYLASDNQQPIDPATDSSYLGADWPPPWRAMRINALLRADSAVTPDDMRRFQTDPGSARADRFVPAFLAAARARDANDSTLREAAMLLAQWDRRYTRDNQRAVLFEFAMDELQRRTWDELATPEDPAPFQPPSESVLAELLAYPNSVWWDDHRTATVERRDDILASSLAAALRRAEFEYGDPDAGGWRWDRIQHANIYHLLRLPDFSALGLPVQGGPSTLSPSSGSGRYGPSWRMVVEMGPEVHAWSIYPGGQSGNPMSSRYLDRLPRWLAGELDPVRFPRRASDLDSTRIVSTLTLAPSRSSR
ncbi:MAG TPA: penicillin acylase family protein, partial [Gemmatimonadaceae bacterium]